MCLLCFSVFVVLKNQSVPAPYPVHPCYQSSTSLNLSKYATSVRSNEWLQLFYIKTRQCSFYFFNPVSLTFCVFSCFSVFVVLYMIYTDYPVYPYYLSSTSLNLSKYATSVLLNEWLQTCYIRTRQCSFYFFLSCFAYFLCLLWFGAFVVLKKQSAPAPYPVHPTDNATSVLSNEWLQICYDAMKSKSHLIFQSSIRNYVCGNKHKIIVRWFYIIRSQSETFAALASWRWAENPNVSAHFLCLLWFGDFVVLKTKIRSIR